MKKPTSIPKKAIKHLKKNWIKYAFETLVVILGILIAFALSNWNENRIERMLENQYLNSLIKDLKADSTYYEGRIIRAEYIVKTNRDIIREMYQTQHSLEEVKALSSKIGLDSEQLTTQNVTYIELMNSGRLDVLKNQNLKDAIIQYYRKNEEASKHIAEINDFSTRHLFELGKTHRYGLKLDVKLTADIYNGMDVIKDKDWAYINDPDSEIFQSVEYTITIYRFKHQVFLDYFKSLKSMSTQLIKDIQNELDSRN